jgi:iron(III) transport system substrate-binding protein
MFLSRFWSFFGLAFVLLFGLPEPSWAHNQIYLYSSRKEHLIKPQIDLFQKKTGITVKLLSASGEEILQRLQSEGKNSPADMVYLADVAHLDQGKRMGLFKPMKPLNDLGALIPSHLQDPEHYWFPIGLRLRPILYVKGKVDPNQIKTYADLADPKWKGKILTRSSNHPYTQSLLASMICHLGSEPAEQWAKGVLQNLARKPQGGDSDQILAAAAGQGDLVLANTYYYGRMLASKNATQREAAEKLGVIWPNQSDSGVHANVSGVAIAKHAKHNKQALLLLDFLLSQESQSLMTEQSFEYPIRTDVKFAPVLYQLGSFKMDRLDLSCVAKKNLEAAKLFERIGWR